MSPFLTGLLPSNNLNILNASQPSKTALWRGTAAPRRPLQASVMDKCVNRAASFQIRHKLCTKPRVSAVYGVKAGKADAARASFHLLQYFRSSSGFKI